MSGSPPTSSDPSWRAQMLTDLESGSIARMTDALLALTLNDPDGPWVEKLLLKCLDGSPEIQMRSLAITCLGHVARIHGTITNPEVVPKLKMLSADQLLGGFAEDALDDIKTFTST